MEIDNDPFPEVDELEANSALSTFTKELAEELPFGKAKICTGFPYFGNDSYASLRAKAGSINAKALVQVKAESSGGSAKPSPMLEVGFMQHLCLKCRANYLQFKDLASKGEKTFQTVTSQFIKIGRASCRERVCQYV